MARILIVDDCEQIRFFLAKIFEMSGFTGARAVDGSSAIKK